jgi:phytoene dehydrogenase-like protein
MEKKIIIIGGGVAGLSAGIYGQMNGFETEIYEMHSITGGQCTAWDRRGYRFDFCLHWLVGTSYGSLNRVWKETHVINSHTTIVDSDIHTVLVNEKGEEFILYTNISRWEKYLTDMAPEDAGKIRRMCRQMRKAASYEPIDTTKSSAFSIIKTILKMAPIFPLLIRYGKKNCREYFQTLHFKNPKLAWFMDNLFGDRNFSALAFLMMLGWFDKKNAGYLIGGSLPFAKRMEDYYNMLGGKVLMGKKVERITVENHTATGVVLADGTVVKCDYVISAADGYNTIFSMLQGEYVSPKIKKAYDTWPTFTPLVQVSFGINAGTKPGYSSINVIDKGRQIGSTTLESGYALMNYSFDPTMAPEGKTVVVMRFESPWENWKDMGTEAYRTEKEKIRADATELLALHYPGIKEHIEVVDVATPLTDARYTGVWKGAYEGFMPTPDNIAKQLKNTLPGLKNFYMAGQWLAPGGGLPPSVISGKKAIKNICDDEQKVFEVV